MHFQATIVTIIGLASLASSMIVPKLPDGLWTSIEQEDGTFITTSLDNPELPAIVSPAPTTENAAVRLSRSARLSNRDAVCWGHQLNPQGTDLSGDCLAGWAGNGKNFCTSNKNRWYGCSSSGVLVYYCIEGRNDYCGNLSLDDVRYAMRKMDDVCPRYRAGFFKWPGSPELVGKARTSDTICIG